jgi:hypothetical protein
MVSGIPWITGSSLAPSGSTTITFPRVTKSFTVINSVSTGGAHNDLNTGSLAIYFGPTPTTSDWNGSNIDQLAKNHYVELTDPQDAFTFDVKCKEVHVTALGFNGANTPQTSGCSGSFLLIAELTSVDANEMYALTGSGIDV